MSETRVNDARSLLRAAAHVFDGSADLSTAGGRAWRWGFSSGADWMRRGLEVLRNEPLPARPRAFQLIGLAKYAASTVAAVISAAAAFRIGGVPLAGVCALLAFYAVEAQGVFLFPVLLDGSPRPVRESLCWTRRAGGTLAVMGTVLPLAATMLLGGFLGRGFVRSWCVGCLAVCVWYERLRAASRPEPRRPGLLVRRERVSGWHLPRPLAVLYASDLHLGRPWTGRAAVDLLRAARSTRPDVVLLGGDLLDRAAGAPLLGRCVRRLARLAPVYAVPGNHDARAGTHVVRNAVVFAGGAWLPDGPVALGSEVRLVATVPDDAPSEPRTILCGHDPAAFPTAARAGVRLVLAGHLHGGQCVLFRRGHRLYPGAWFARWTGLRFALGDSTMIVSRGAADTLPLRFNCPKEVILCQIS